MKLLLFFQSELTRDDSGTYVCISSSLRGVTQASAELQVVRPGSDARYVRAPNPDTAPGPPPTPTLLHANGTSARLRWSPPSRPGASPVTSYTLEYYSSAGGTWQVAASKTSATVLTLAPLDPSHSYGVTVRAHNIHGVSEPSGIAEVGGDGGQWMKKFEGPLEMKLQQAKVTLQEVIPTLSSSAKIIWQVRFSSL